MFIINTKMVRKLQNKGRSADDLNKYVGRILKFYDVKQRKSRKLPITHLKKYSLAKKSNRLRSKGRCSVIAFATHNKRSLPRALGIFDCKNVSLQRQASHKSKSAKKSSKKGSRKH